MNAIRSAWDWLMAGLVVNRLRDVHRVAAIREEIDLDGQRMWVVTITEGATKGWSYRGSTRVRP